MDDYAATYTIYPESAQENAPARSVLRRPIIRHIPLSSFVALATSLDAALLIFLSHYLSAPRFDTTAGQPYVTGLAAAILVQLYLWVRLDLYSVEIISDFPKFLRRLLIVFAGVSGAALAVIAIVTHLVNLIVIAPAILAAVLASFFLFGALRYCVHRLFQFCVERRVIDQAVVLVGVSEHMPRFIEHVSQSRTGTRIRAIYDDREEFAGKSIQGVPVAGKICDILSDHRRFKIDHVVITGTAEDRESRQALLQRLSMQPLRVRMLPDDFGLNTVSRAVPPGEIPGIALVPVLDLPINGFWQLTKDLFDRLAALMALVFFAPVLLFCVLGIKLSSKGPVLYRQKRIGYANRSFSVYKFRSMHIEACDMLRLTSRNDPRVFPFGQLMRKLSFDELPQLFNVLRGEMSLVGPRPHMFEARAGEYYYFDIVPNYAARHRVKPGITGWAQVNGWRGPTETAEAIEQRVAHDLHYIANWSFLLDLKILFKTAFGGFFGKNAF